MGDPLSACESSHCDSRTTNAAQAHPASLTHDAATATAHTQSVKSMICPCTHCNTIQELSDHGDAKIVAQIVLQVAQMKIAVQNFGGMRFQAGVGLLAPHPPPLRRMATGLTGNRGDGDPRPPLEGRAKARAEATGAFKCRRACPVSATRSTCVPDRPRFSTMTASSAYSALHASA